jgi:hypothetical protein
MMIFILFHIPGHINTIYIKITVQRVSVLTDLGLEWIVFSAILGSLGASAIGSFLTRAARIVDAQ